MMPQNRHLAESDLLQIEHALLAALLDVSGEGCNAIEQFLNRFEGPRPDVEMLLVTAVSDTQSGRTQALDRILDRVTKTTPAA